MKPGSSTTTIFAWKRLVSSVLVTMENLLKTDVLAPIALQSTTPALPTPPQFTIIIYWWCWYSVYTVRVNELAFTLNYDLECAFLYEPPHRILSAYLLVNNATRKCNLRSGKTLKRRWDLVKRAPLRVNYFKMYTFIDYDFKLHRHQTAVYRNCILRV